MIVAKWLPDRGAEGSEEELVPVAIEVPRGEGEVDLHIRPGSRAATLSFEIDDGWSFARQFVRALVEAEAHRADAGVTP